MNRLSSATVTSKRCRFCASSPVTQFTAAEHPQCHPDRVSDLGPHPRLLAALDLDGPPSIWPLFTLPVAAVRAFLRGQRMVTAHRDLRLRGAARLLALRRRLHLLRKLHPVRPAMTAPGSRLRRDGVGRAATARARRPAAASVVQPGEGLRSKRFSDRDLRKSKQVRPRFLQDQLRSRRFG